MNSKERVKNFIRRFISFAKKNSNIVALNFPDKKVYFAICAIIKNEGSGIIEWIEYHLLIGVQLFFLYDNESTDDTHSKLKKYIEKGIVIYITCPGKKMQRPAYNDCISRFKNYARWIAFIDADEFFVVNEEVNLRGFMKKYEDEVGLVVNWQMFDSNGYKNKPINKLTIEAYTQIHANYNEDNLHIKSIVNPKWVQFYVNPHYPLFYLFRTSVDSRGNKVYGSKTKKQDISKIQLNHYFSKSEEEFLEKINRGKADQGTKRIFRDELKRLNFDDGIQDNTMGKYTPLLKKKLNDYVQEE
jgi:hypothetical protein